MTGLKHEELAALPPKETVINVCLLKMTGSSQPLYQVNTLGHLLVELCKARK